MIDPVRTQKIGSVTPSYEAPGDPKVVVTPGQQPAPAARASTEKPRLLDFASDVAGQGEPIDQARVAELRAAIEEGRYGLNPRATAKAMIDFARSEKP